jgi:hypothetical protein
MLPLYLYMSMPFWLSVIRESVILGIVVAPFFTITDWQHQKIDVHSMIIKMKKIWFKIL